MNTYDTVISLLGDTGKQQWTRSEIIDIISDRLRIEKATAISRWNDTFSRTDYFEKIGDDPAKFQYTKSGRVRYETLQRTERADGNFDKSMETFIKKYYWSEFLTCINDENEFIDIEYNTLLKGFPYAVEMLENKPTQAINKLNNSLRKIIAPADSEFRPVVSIINTGNVLQVEDIKTRHVGKFVEVEGRVATQIIPKSELVIGAFKCARCGEITYLPQSGVYAEPYLCENDVCERKGPFKLLDPPESEYRDAQEIVIESLRGGQVTITAHFSGSLCRPPWERDAKVIRVCGIVRTRQTVIGPKTKSTYFDQMIEVCSIKFADDSNTEPPTEEEIKLFDEWAKTPSELRQTILELIAPNIYGSLEIKDACSLSLFSDWCWDLDPRDVIERSSIHVLLFGDPGVAKSQIIRDVVYLAPKGKFGQVTNMTRGGLSTVAVQEGGEWCVKSGFFSQADQGVAGLDELDKVHEDKDLNCLVTVLNDQIQLVSKIGKNDIPFNTRAAVLGAANPKGGYLKKEDVISQIGAVLPSYIYQRFDMIFVVRDVHDKERDSIVADSINSMHSNPKASRKNMPRVITPELFKKYVIYARTKPVPEFEPSAQKIIKEYYLKLRTISADYPVIGARQVNNINRIARAVARRELAAKITEEHVKYAIGLMRASLSTLSDDQDYGIYNFGRTKSQAELVKQVRGAIQEICKKERFARIEDIAFTTNLETVQIGHVLILMEGAREVYRVKDGYRIP
ncbi:MAG: minichromosome maintenance protein MCM [Candidatus Methanoperedens sp.]|nr:minichromosome maintenance protein MCM [Candidatus Methanoperedens sp.]